MLNIQLKNVTLLLCGCFLCAQDLSIVQDSIVLSEVTVSIARLKNPKNLISQSFSLQQIDEQYAHLQELHLGDYVGNIPGLFVSNTHNYAQDARISIRGFGARSPFGIRGIRVVVDGIPETTPDGQSQVDNINVEILDRIEVLRGVASVLYGNASGGVIQLQTLEDISKNFLRVGTSLGAFDTQKYQLQGGVVSKNTSYIFHGSQTQSNGYRDFSGFKSQNANLKIVKRLSSDESLRFVANYVYSPYAKDAGGLTLEEVNQNRQQARDRNLDFNSQEKVEQGKLGLHYTTLLANNTELEAYTFFSKRFFLGKLPYERGGYVDLNRNHMGLGVNVSKKSFKKMRWLLGIETAYQKDARKRFVNLNGLKGAQTLDQNELFSTVGVFGMLEIDLKKWLVTTGIRTDAHWIEAQNQLTDLNPSSNILRLNAWNPTLSFHYTPNSQWRFFGNTTSGFETPTLNELSANPLGNAGFNSTLRSQLSMQTEIGAYFTTPSSRFRMEVVGFLIKTQDEIVPYELENMPDQTFYRNAGKTRRLGIEIATEYHPHSNWKMSLTASHGTFEFDEFKVYSETFTGNKLPGVPQNLAYFKIEYSNSNNLLVQLNTRYTGKIMANNSNDASVQSSWVLNLSASQKIKVFQTNILPFIGINNLTDTSYFDNIRINAFGGRFYEPAPGIYGYGGVKLEW
jgi:iron complex outermembrane receptor protein